MSINRVPRLTFILVALLALMLVAGANVVPVAVAAGNTYTNPLQIQIPGDGRVESCADPSITYSQTTGDTNWYMYCTTDPLNDADRNGSNYNFHLIPMLRSPDLVHWTYMGDAFTTRPAWVAPTAGLWAPDIEYLNGQYYLYYTASDTSLPGGGSAIGVATSNSPLGPWVDAGAPAVEPHAAPCCPGSRRWVFDPEVVSDNGRLYIFYGSYFGGISARTLSADGLHSDPATQVQITIANKYEGAEVVKRGDYWYLFVSATNCCNGPLTGYSVFAGRSANLLGPYVDRDGHSLLEGQTGGTVVLSMNGNRWVGPGHNSVFQDFSGQWWTVYHAVDQNDPYFADAVGFTRRPVLMDPLDWQNGWPVVRGGLFASDRPMPVPAAQPGTKTDYQPIWYHTPKPEDKIARLSDEFNGHAINARWTWVRPPNPGTYDVSNGTLNWQTQAADLYVDSNNASVLAEPAPRDDYMVETRVKVDVPAEGCCFNYVQAGLVIYGDDDNFIKLTDVSIWETRQTEFAKELFPVPNGYPRYGNTVVGPPGEWTWLRIVKQARGGQEFYTAFTSPDGIRWDHGGTWTHALGSKARIGLVSMGGSGFTATFDYVRVYRIDE